MLRLFTKEKCKVGPTHATKEYLIRNLDTRQRYVVSLGSCRKRIFTRYLKYAL